MTNENKTDTVETERFELDQIHLRLESDHHIGSPDPGHEAKCWRTSLTALSERNDEVLVLATAELWTIPGTVTDPIQTLIDTDTDLARFQTIFKDGYIDPDLNVAGFGEGVIIIETIETPPIHRGCGYTRLLLAESLNALQIGNLIAVATPTRDQGPGCASSPGSNDRGVLVGKTAEHLGFCEWRNGVWVMNLTTNALGHAQEYCHEHLGS